MSYDKQSLISKIAGKGVITPYEAIHLQYLNKLYIKKKILEIKSYDNTYVTVEKIAGLFSKPDLNRILTFQTIEEISQYDAYRWAANFMTNLDSGTGELGYKAIALLNEFRYLQSEYTLKISRDLRDGKEVEGDIFDFSGYSQVHQQTMTVRQVLSSFSEALNILITSIDTILTLNYYLRSMVEKEEYTCLKFLSIILAEKKVEDEDERGTNVAHLFYQQVATPLIENNHTKFVQFMQWKMNILGVRLNETFYEGSLEYVKTALNEISDTYLKK